MGLNVDHISGLYTKDELVQLHCKVSPIPEAVVWDMTKDRIIRLLYLRYMKKQRFIVENYDFHTVPFDVYLYNLWLNTVKIRRVLC